MEDYADFLKWKKASMKALDRAVSGQHDEKKCPGWSWFCRAFPIFAVTENTSWPNVVSRQLNLETLVLLFKISHEKISLFALGQSGQQTYTQNGNPTKSPSLPSSTSPL
ncbi:hypothetical protein T06_15739 [Trichinella sp. T6]|nr:hypothetical protein T06_15739 [Trichinella sp. T6]